jgi:hypothetical protein
MAPLTLTIRYRVRPRWFLPALSFVGWLIPVLGSSRATRLCNWMLSRARMEYRIGKGRWQRKPLAECGRFEEAA